MSRTGWTRWMVGAVVGVVALAGPNVRGQSDGQLVDTFDKAEAAGNYADALGAALTIVQRHPDSTIWLFNAGRMQARTGHADEAIALLQKCADGGFSGISSFEDHADLDTLRSRPEFAAIVAKVRTNAENRMGEFQREALAHRHPEYVPRSIAKGSHPPVIIALHGTGGTGNDMIRALKRSCDALGMVCLAPDAIRPTGNGYSWTYRDESAWLIEHMIEVAVKEHGADPNRVYLVGFSQGANIALVMAKTHAAKIAGVVPVCGHYEPNVVASGAKDPAPAPTYLISGSRDPWHETNERAKADFVVAGASAEVRIVDGMGHQIPGAPVMTEALQWCVEHTAKPEG